MAAVWCRRPEGVIVRTQAGRQSEERLGRSFGLLREKWQTILANAETDGSPRLLEQALPFVEWILSENRLSSVGAIYTNCEIELTKRLPKTQIIREREADMFRRHSLEEAFERAMKRVVYLKSGAALAIDYTEALTAIDVNSRAFSGKKGWEGAAFQINCEAAEEIARQLRLRQIGGIIIVDFIHMADHNRLAQLLAFLADLFQNDPTTTKVLGCTQLGLVEISRKKKRYGLQDLAMEKVRFAGSD
ncbi:ribonuclease E/G [Terrilactibacillus sp. S3-3]|nr:ribonuclease E/G [Terrilactibacillus sp. S3-3]